MKKLLLITGLTVGCAGAMQAQVKTTEVVDLTTGMTAQLELNNDTETATLTFTGPSDRWYALQIGSFATGGGMNDGMDVVWSNGTTLVDGVHNGQGFAPSTDTNHWTVESNEVSGTTRTIIATRDFDTGDANDYEFVYSNTSIDFAWAKNTSAGYVLAGHGVNRGYDLNNDFTCVLALPEAPEEQELCAWSTVADLEAEGEDGAEINWYAAEEGGSPLAENTILDDASYWVSQTVGDCESARVEVEVSLIVVPDPEVPDPSPEFCSEATIADIEVTGAEGATINWYENEIGGSPLAGNTVLEEGSYFVSQTVNGCESERTEVNVNFITLANPVINDTTPAVCEGTTLADISVDMLEGAEISWYAENDSEMPLASSTVVAGGEDYFVEQMLGDCVSNRIGITPEIADLDAPAPTAEQEHCQFSTVSNLESGIIEGATANWYTTIGGEPLDEDEELTAGTYYVSQTLNGCESDTAEVTVMIILAPADPVVVNEVQEFTAGATVADLEVTLLEGATANWYVMDGEDMEPIDTTEVLVDGMVYYVSQTLGGCESGTVAITADEVLGNPSFTLEGLEVYPNPVVDVLTVSYTDTISEIVVVNMLGQKVISQKVNANKAGVEVSQLQHGNYILNVYTANGEFASMKIVK